MNIVFRNVALTISLALALAGCETVRTTQAGMVGVDRQQRMAVSAQAMEQGAAKQYGQLMAEADKKNKRNTDTAQFERVRQIGDKLIAQVAAFRPDARSWRWEINVLSSPEVNAWCMPGGKIVVYTGILPITKDEAGLATVLGHEVSHALANHGQQRMSAGLLQQLGAAGVGVAVGSKSEQTQQIAMTAYGAATQYGGMLPFSRSHESEADKIGLTLMAIAGYNPEQAVVFWERMAANSSASGKAPAEFASTHPSDATRIADLKELIPQAKAEALKYGVVFK
jgi:predicted Zn-dependent protease